jgi:hypothetical protein
MELYKQDEYYKVVGLCMEFINSQWRTFLEVYKEALEIEFTNHNIPFEREKIYN